VGTRYALVGVRTLVDSRDPADAAKAHALQDALSAEQQPGALLDIPVWDPATLKSIRDALLVLARTVHDTSRMFGDKGEVDPVKHLIGSAMGWGGLPERDAFYLNVTPKRNDGKTIYRLKVGEVPVDGFWSVSVYNARGYFEHNSSGIYSFNSMTARRDPDGSVEIQFGGCDSRHPNCIPIMEGWNYMVRLYRPRAGILDGSWAFPEAKEVGPAVASPRGNQ
jgi:hypothetical protein